MRKIKEKFLGLSCFLLILIVSSFFRVYGIGRIFYNWDCSVLPYLVMESKNPLWSLFHSYGVFTPLSLEGFVRVLSFFNIPVVEFWWVLPVAVVGILTVLIIYLLVNILVGTKQALFVSFVLGLLPVHIIASRYSYGYECGYVFLSILSLLLFIKHLKSKGIFYGICFSIVFSLYVLTHFLFPLMFLIFFWSVVVMKTDKENVLSVKRVFLNKVFILPALCILFEVCIALMVVFDSGNYFSFVEKNFFGHYSNYYYYSQTPIAHHLLRLRFLSVQRFNLSSECFFQADFISFWNIWLYLILISLPFGVHEALRSTKKSIFFLWGVVYLIPFIAIELIFNVGMVTYLSFGLVPLAIYTAMFFYDTTSRVLAGVHKKLRKVVFVLFLVFIIASLFISALYKVFQFDAFAYFRGEENPFLDRQMWYRNAYQYDAGYKTAGYYIRKYAAANRNIYIYDLNFRVFLDKFYLAREGMFSGSSYEEAKGLFEKGIDDIDIVISVPEGREFFDSFDSIEIKSKIYSNTLNREQKLVLLIYGKENIMLPKINMNTDEYNQLYDAKYSFSVK
ncbi:MAG: hypothetical protein KKD07_06410 [Candidatus Omnitrophica bacterium]|nr:hypothetical protein [Candidatus Omnitrophota bacterium]MBU1997693.1 hypothetical protein [Candidatus Omnitrophota bacterium]MBU4334056.1 hypothetical protein [Candidatus Omnitrophota bacterium]